MALPKVNETLLENLEAMGFPRARAMRALYYSGNTTLEEAINWIVEHENDADIDEMPSVDIDIEIESSDSFPISDEIKMKAQLLRDQNRKRKEDEEKKLEREREKERIQAGKKLLEAKRIAEENERKRNLALRKAEKDEEKRARARVLQKLQQDKLSRRSMLVNPQESHAALNSSDIPIQKERNPKPVYRVAKTDHLSDCLRSLRRNHKSEDARVRRAFQTLSIYVGNVVKNPNEEKYRKIRLSNPLFQERVGSLHGGMEFLELCGFERIGEFLHLPDEKIDMAVLKSARSALNNAMTNPFFGLLRTWTL
ncbi:hypothetical protein L6164_000408 [Bauhinia variegata]|uniref:Uncharacterized protein n=1 Tax=Bauhinia variegata TaxID=167791 RepID=A0ACB9Q6E5_BAUVA|nr:hypothetical protein L6164_000408 [Bauhinia variegata]